MQKACEKAGYRLEEGAKERLKEILREESEDNIGFGNARGVRNLFEQAIARQANRLANFLLQRGLEKGRKV